MQEIPQGFFLALTVFLGLVLGSFATALAYRLPRGISIVKMKRSACPACKRSLGFPDLVPVFSWVFLKGKCRTCKAPIGWEYPLIEVATLLLCLAFYARFGFTPFTLCLFALAPVATSIVAIDFRFKIIPDSLNAALLCLGIAGLAACAAENAAPLPFLLEKGGESLLAAVAYLGVSLGLRYGLMAALKKDPLGWGDIKFFGAAGFWLGLNPDSAAYLMLVSGVFGILLALTWKKVKKESEFPFGPAVLAGFVSMLLWQGPSFLPT